MVPFNLTQASSIDDAIKSDATFLAGGTTLIDLMKLYVVQPKSVIDISRLPLDKIEPQADGSVKIGAMVRNSDAAYHDHIAKNFPVLSQAILSGATESLRNMATMGGNLLQRTRCPYYRDGISPCNMRQPGSGCSMKDGFNRAAAVLGTSDKCVATNPGDMSVALLALDAVVHLQAKDGKTRDVPIGDFHVSYGEDPAKISVLEPGELITGVSIPASPRARQAYTKVRDRASYEFALASCAAAIEFDGGVVKSCRLALGGVGTKPWRADIAEHILTHAKPSPDLLKLVADKALEGATPLQHNAFKIELAKRCVVKTLEGLVIS